MIILATVSWRERGTHIKIDRRREMGNGWFENRKQRPMCKLDDWFNNGLPVADRLEEKRGHVSIIHGDILARLANCRMPD